MKKWKLLSIILALGALILGLLDSIRNTPYARSILPARFAASSFGHSCEELGAFTDYEPCSTESQGSGCYFLDLTGNGIMCWKPIEGPIQSHSEESEDEGHDPVTSEQSSPAAKAAADPCQEFNAFSDRSDCWYQGRECVEIDAN